jgi:hypothetical protein
MHWKQCIFFLNFLTKMKLTSIHCTGYQAKLAGFLPTSWSMVNPSNDREIQAPGFREGWDD